MLTKYSTKQEAKEWLKDNRVDKYDNRAGCILTIDCRLIDLVRDDAVDPIAGKLASKLAMLIDYRNVAYTTTTQIAEQLGIRKDNINRSIKLLDDNGLVIALSNKGVKKPERTLVFNPSIFWRGLIMYEAFMKRKC